MTSRQANSIVVAVLSVALVLLIGFKYGWQQAAQSGIALAMFLVQTAVLFFAGISVLEGGARRRLGIAAGAALSAGYCALLLYSGAVRLLISHAVLSVALSIVLVLIARRATRR